MEVEGLDNKRGASNTLEEEERREEKRGYWVPKACEGLRRDKEEEKKKEEIN